MFWQVYGFLACRQLHKVGLHLDTAFCQDEELVSMGSHLQAKQTPSHLRLMTWDQTFSSCVVQHGHGRVKISVETLSKCQLWFCFSLWCKGNHCLI